MVFGQKWPTIGNEWEMGKKIENTENVCVYNQQIPHDAEKIAQQWRGETLKHLECKINTSTHTHAHTHTHTLVHTHTPMNWCDCNTANM